MTALCGRSATQILLALDRSLHADSVRSIDSDGHLKVAESRISKAAVNGYLGNEIPGWQELKLDPQRTYRLFRDPEELKKAAATFDGKPLLIRHVPVTAAAHRQELVVGSVGPVTWESPYLVARPLTVWTAEAIRLIESGEQKELSSAYRYRPDMTPGTWGGETYDGVMRDLEANHVAIVSEGRAGSDVHVADELPPELRAMTTAASKVAAAIKKYLGKDANTALIALALDGALGETPEESVMSLDESEKKAAEDEWKTEHGKDEMTDEEREEAYSKARDRKKAKDKKARDAKAAKDKKAADMKRAKDSAAADARDSAMDAREAAMDEREEKDDEDDDSEEAKDRKKARDSRKAARDKRAKDGARDANPDHRKDFEPIKGEDSVSKDELPEILKAHGEGIRQQMRDAAQAREQVRTLVGVVPIAMDSADDIRRFALKHAGVKAEKVTDSEALAAMVEMAVQAKSRRPNAPSGGMALDASVAGFASVDDIFGPQKAA